MNSNDRQQPHAPPCTRCGLADAVYEVVLVPAFARRLGRSETEFLDQALSACCWQQLFGQIPSVEQFVRRRKRIGEQDMEAARAMIERSGWDEGR